MANKELADVYGGDLEDDRSLFTHIERGLQKNPHGPAVIVMHQAANHLAELTTTADADQVENGHKTNGSSGEECLTWTFTQLHEAALKFTTGLQA